MIIRIVRLNPKNQPGPNISQFSISSIIKYDRIASNKYVLKV